MSVFISATDTNVGKTFFAALLLKFASTQLPIDQLAYYKPIQCGQPSDYDYISNQCEGLATYCSYDLKEAASPNFAARLEQTKINLDKIKQDFASIQSKHSIIVVEGAGGLAVPINEQETIADIVKALKLPLILVTRRDLGTINHSLLTVNYAQAKGIKLKGLWFRDLIDSGFNSAAVEDSIQTICQITNLPILKLEDCI